MPLTPSLQTAAQDPQPQPLPLRKSSWRWWGVAVAFGALVSVWASAQVGPAAAPAGEPPVVAPVSPAVASASFVKGGNISAWNVSDVARVFADAERLGLDTITVAVRIPMPSATSSAVDIDPVSLAFAQKVVAHSAKYRYIIEPYPWIADGAVPETDLNPTDKAAWFAAYQGAVVRLARQFPNAWGIYVASNLVKLEDQAPQWQTLVAAVRAAFAGKVIYRTQWWVTAAWEPSTLTAWKTKLENPIFGAVDVIAIAAYFELTELPAPTTAEIKAALRSSTVFGRKQDVFAEITALQKRWKKPVFLGELSCPAVDFGAQTPWDPAAGDKPNADIQRNYLSAYLETFSGRTTEFLGFSVFTIGHPTPTTYDLAPAAAEYVRTFKPRQL